MRIFSFAPRLALLSAAFFSVAAIAAPVPPSITLPIGTQIPAVLTRPVWAATVAPGELLYAQTLTDVSVGNQIVIPGGTFVEATVGAVVKPTSTSKHALFQIKYNQLIYANGYVMSLSGTG